MVSHVELSVPVRLHVFIVDSDVIVPIGSSLLMMESNRMSQLVHNCTMLKLSSYYKEYVTNIKLCDLIRVHLSHHSTFQ